MGPFRDIDANTDHRKDLTVEIEAGILPTRRELPTTLCVNRGLTHNLLIRGRSRSRGDSLSAEAHCFKEFVRSPGPVVRNPTPP